MEIQSNNKKITFPNRTYSDIAQFYLQLCIMNSPELKEIEKLVRSQLKEGNYPLVGTAYRFDHKEATLIVLITDINGDLSDFGFISLYIRKKVFNQGGSCVWGEFYDGLVCHRGTAQNYGLRINKSNDGNIKIFSNKFDTIEQISIDTFFELVKSYKLLHNFSNKI